MKVSVIIPCFNSELTIERTLNSVLEQTFANIEIIIVDDCSSDNTFNIIQGFSKQYNNCKVSTTKVNSGSPSTPRNIGLKESSGDFICFLDSDDIWYKRKVEVQLDYMLEHEVVFSYLPYDISVDGVRISSYYPLKVVDFESLLNLNIVGCLTTMIKKNVIGDIQFQEIKLEDYDFWLKILNRVGYAYCASNVSLASYNKVEGSRSSDKLNLVSGYWCILLFHSNNNYFKAVHRLFNYFKNYFFKYKL
jgi:teichuronic acid biosynthesis glycosyltransferase TuaG